MSSEEITPEAITAQLKENGVLDVETKTGDQLNMDMENDPKAAMEEQVHEQEEADVEMSVQEEAEVPMQDEGDEPSEVEAEAMAKGWKPDGPKSAEEFLRAEPLYEEIKQRGKEIKNLKAQLDEITKHVGSLKKAGYQEKIDVIQAEREEAVARSDMESLEYLDSELAKVQTQMAQEQQAPSTHPAAQDFLDRHKDIMQDYSLEAQEIKDFISERDVQLASFNLDPELHMKTLEKDMKDRFPSRFETQTETVTNSAVESDSRPVTARRRAKHTFKDLTPDQKSVYKYMEKKGVMTGKEYIEQLVEIGELK